MKCASALTLLTFVNLTLIRTKCTHGAVTVSTENSDLRAENTAFSNRVLSNKNVKVTYFHVKFNTRNKR